MALPQITWTDLQQLPDDGLRYEAIQGDLYVTPAPSLRHQTVLVRLLGELLRLLVIPGHGQVWPAPLGVEFPGTGEGVQPDLVYVSSERRELFAADGLKGPPDLVVEILSPSTAARDRGIKRALYERQGVREYWIVDPEESTVDVWRLATSHERHPRVWHDRYRDLLPVKVGTDIVGRIELDRIFAPI